MQEPKRLLENPILSPDSRALLESLSPTPSMPLEVQADLAARVDQIATAAPAGSALWLMLATIVGLGVTWWAVQPVPSTPVLAPPLTKIDPQPIHQLRYVEPKTAVPDLRPAFGRERLAEELRLLDGAHERSEVEALAQVRAHRRRFPMGQLSDLRDYVEIQIYVRRGDLTRARQLGDRFLATHPESALINELERTLFDDDAR